MNKHGIKILITKCREKQRLWKKRITQKRFNSTKAARLSKFWERKKLFYLWLLKVDYKKIVRKK